jgi:cytochrome b6-f complex iron-sulfur subunit
MEKEQSQIERRDFLKNLGLGGAALMAVYCAGMLSSCKSADVTPSVAQFSLNLDDAANAPLKTNGGYIIKNEVVIAKTAKGDYVAVTVLCRHENLKQVIYQKSSDEFYCTAHQARFDLTGKGLNQNGKDGLKTYPVVIQDSGKTLLIG